jgi:hypothetical protein
VSRKLTDPMEMHTASFGSKYDSIHNALLQSVNENRPLSTKPQRLVHMPEVGIMIPL